jgi:hypothetical protein
VTIPPRPVTRRDVKKFIDHCVILRACWTHYQTIFEGSDLQRELLQNTAHKFFCDLNHLLIQHLILRPNHCRAARLSPRLNPDSGHPSVLHAEFEVEVRGRFST